MRRLYDPFKIATAGKLLFELTYVGSDQYWPAHVSHEVSNQSSRDPDLSARSAKDRFARAHRSSPIPVRVSPHALYICGLPLTGAPLPSTTTLVLPRWSPIRNTGAFAPTRIAPE